MDHSDTQIGAGESRFPATAWTLLSQLRDPGDPAFRVYLERMIGLYWRPVYKFVRIVWKRSNEDAKDLTQSFFIHLMEGSLLQRADPEKGNFRKLLLTSLRNYLINVERDGQAEKRGGGRHLVALDGELDGPSVSGTGDPGAEFNAQWAHEVLERSIDALRRRAPPHVFRAFEGFHLKGLPVREISRNLGATEAQVAHYLQDARKLLRSFVTEEIRQYVVDEQELVAELDTLFQSWR